VTGKDGHLSFQTLVIASLSSAAAALLTSFVWESGTVFSAAFTPVIVSIVGEALKRPAKTISQVRPVRRDRATSTGRGTPAMSGVPSPARAAPSPAGGDPVPWGDTAPSGDTTPSVTSSTAGGVARGGRGFVRLFGRRVNMRLALATGGLAFVIAAAFLTLPELVAGESVAGQPGRTTLGGGSSVDTSGESSGPSAESDPDAPGDAKDAGAEQDGERTAPESESPSGAEPQEPSAQGEGERSRLPQQQRPTEEPPAAGEPPSPQPQSPQPPSQSP